MLWASTLAQLGAVLCLGYIAWATTKTLFALPNEVLSWKRWRWVRATPMLGLGIMLIGFGNPTDLTPGALIITGLFLWSEYLLRVKQKKILPTKS